MSSFLAAGGGALLGGLLGALAGVFGARATSRTARREQVWKRVEWAIELVLRDDERARELGYVGLQEIVERDLADKRDVELIIALASAAFGGLELRDDLDSADFVLLPRQDDGEAGGVADGQP